MRKFLFVLLAVLLLPALNVAAATITVKVTTDKTSYLRGEKISITATALYADGKPVVNVRKKEVEIKDPTGETVLRTSMTSLGSGKFAYAYQLRSDAKTGSWRIRARVEDTNYVRDDGTIYVKVSSTTQPPADTTAPVTSATPGGGTYSGPVSVTLAANEPATIYYSTNGSTPTTASAVYSSPIAIATTATLKYFARDAAGNSEVVKSITYTIAPPTTGNPHANLTWNGAGTCLACHTTQAKEVHASVHYQWQGASPKVTNHPTSGGKNAGAINAYCINIMGNWNSCSACHVGLGATPTTTADTAQLQNIDCLICHQEKYKRVKVNGLFVPDVANMTITMDQAVQSLHLPTRTTCLQCHAKAGGGDAVKRGDLALAHGATTDRAFDVHMANTGANLSCQACHQTSQHKIPGRGSDLRPSEGSVAVSCSTTSCHSSKTTTTGHATVDINKHVARVACQTCHIKSYARNASDTVATEATETFRDWQQPHLGTTGTYHPLMTLANDLKPVYTFWNGTSWGYNLFDAAVLDSKTGAYQVSRPLGGINDAAAKLYPFKYKTASQPYANMRNQLIALDTAVYFASGNPFNAIQSGLVNMGYAADEPYTMVTTDEYQTLNHEVMAKEQALTCTNCHSTTSQMDLKSIGYALKGAATTVCVQCHSYESNPGFTSVHAKHVTSQQYDCSFCHTFSRPERGLRTTR